MNYHIIVIQLKVLCFRNRLFTIKLFFLLNDFVGKMAALINQYYEYCTLKGQNNDSDMYNLCNGVMFKKVTYIP